MVATMTTTPVAGSFSGDIEAMMTTSDNVTNLDEEFEPPAMDVGEIDEQVEDAFMHLSRRLLTGSAPLYSTPL